MKVFCLTHVFNLLVQVSQHTHIFTSPITSSLWTPVTSNWFSPFKHKYLSFPFTNSEALQNLILTMIPRPSTYFHYPWLFISPNSLFFQLLYHEHTYQSNSHHNSLEDQLKHAKRTYKVKHIKKKPTSIDTAKITGKRISLLLQNRDRWTHRAAAR